MSLEIVNLTKFFDEQAAVDNISFVAPSGQITGFLGPNGAGKSTTMKIATGFSLATLGSVLVDDVDVSKDPLTVKKITGYLPEHNPLYLDMYVREFLRFIGRAYRVKNVKAKVEEMIELIGLTRERNKKIGTLSKGYRQRVGLAQAMIHDPSVLILDEPTTGLDPNQIIEIRNIIKDISKERTVLLSTHIMQEVEAICDKVVIIDNGKIVADDEVSVLKVGDNEKQGFKMSFESVVDEKLFERFNIEKVSGSEIIVRSEKENLRAELLGIISENDLPLSSIVKAQEQSLEEVFRKLTQSKD
ncbi:MAG: ATP-binding cassette domain-containing protein [Cytophagales bacterium]|nr:ATP-binding cassette domain-containing protein [Cytophagales bacterium]